MLKKYTKKIIIIMIFSILVILINGRVNATSINISPSNPSVGDTVTITVSVPNVNTASVIANVSGAVSGNIKVVGGDLSGDVSNYSKSEKFKCEKEGEIKVSISDSSSAVLKGNYVDVGAYASVKVSAKKTEITPSDKPSGDSAQTTKKSNNANLSNLGIKPNDFKGFKVSKTSYDVTVPNDIEKVTVYATAQDKKATIKGNGTQKLNVGKNALNVVVTAEDGTTKTYTINVTREEAKNDKNETTDNTTSDSTTSENSENKESTSESDLKKLSIKGYTLSPAFSPNVYEYKVNVNGDVSSLDIETEGTNHSVSIDIVGNENLTDGENTITLLVYNEETKQNSTYQIIVNKTNIDQNDTLNEAVKKANKIRLILLGIVALIIICIIIFIIVKHRLNVNDYEKYEYDEDDKDRLNLDDEDEFFSRLNNKKKDEIFAMKDTSINSTENKNNDNVEQDDEPFYKNSFLQEDTENIEEAEEKIKPKRKGKHF